MTICFNPRAHAGRDDHRRLHRQLQAVSIHAPTRGATQIALQLPSTRHVSIHAPTRGATRNSSCARIPRSFQSTRPRGARPTTNRMRVVKAVSIHAPTRGATVDCSSASKRRDVSIHAPTRGATLRCHAWCMNYQRFNPRAHAGRDDRDARYGRLRIVSIHAPTRGATQAS